jgi:hypothetical protein
MTHDNSDMTFSLWTITVKQNNLFIAKTKKKCCKNIQFFIYYKKHSGFT